ncbi:hypothetical protein PIB30_087316 [Stylosanthes scabra]|uniref:Uncharacterized protein n=1 Tax=Stylosanthes scabra TaxID=79078 RepID=A0ABU6TU42_9FABA|nr:hypothetical protein [Stylosanthes scabra]
MLYPLGNILIWRPKTSDHVCLRFPYPWEWFVVIGSYKGYIFARYSLDRRSSKIIVWNPITNNVRHISDPGSSNTSNNRSVTGLAIYSVVPIEGSRHFLIILLHKRSNFEVTYRMQIYESRINACYYAGQPPNPNNFILQQSTAIGNRVYWINLGGEYPHNPLSVLSYCITDASWIVGTIPPESQIINCPQLISKNNELFYVTIERYSSPNHLHIRSLSIDSENKFQWGPVLAFPSYDIWITRRILIEDQIFGFSRTTADVIARVSSMPAIRIISHISLKMINKNTGEAIESGSLEFDKNVIISEIFISIPLWNGQSESKKSLGMITSCPFHAQFERI